LRLPDASGAAALPALRRLAPEPTWRYAARVVVFAAIAFAVAWVLFIAAPPSDTGVGTWRSTTFGSAVHDPGAFFRILLDAVTFAGLLFIVASGFSLIFGLMRVVNMAHGSFYLLGGYIAYEIQQAMTGQGFSIPGSEVNTWEWVAPVLVASACIAVLGVLIQQLGLRWNQGQELRQALITIAVSVIVADQVIAHFRGGNAVSVTWPGWLNRLLDFHVFSIQYSLASRSASGSASRSGSGSTARAPGW
jgi:branched-chain amino acid transport system permease protein